ncbi:SDR family NAD(P)-dependent oxidoreductase [Anaerocolumna sedimenticola]|uniref:SDR family NAD(P)-dependent oxidoreductase n=1 Tax=Anaerocolumna sedimenticola TaxID=2696063 RepID=A0A6P1TUB9_9FIRM|nr:SDR family NAD(P)-dependent oxidoreductase [Anaerocolumna sedimenticola]QHQ63276.1 SDR family NAD(P)-dependent oxidoreductase [Anaerocolumna sedimenticola]
MNTVIIGAAKGLGLCLTEQLLNKGFHVAAGTISQTSGLLALKEKYGDSLLIFEADVTNEKQIEEGAKKCSEFLGKIDAACIVAGVLLEGDRTNLLHECDITELKKTLEINVAGPVTAVKYLFPYLKDGANVFLVTSEGIGISNCGTWVPCYALSKTAATKACGILNQSVQNVNFYAVHPGRMNTDMGRTTAQIEPEESAAGFCRLLSGETPVSRDCWYIDYKGNKMNY